MAIIKMKWKGFIFCYDKYDPTRKLQETLIKNIEYIRQYSEQKKMQVSGIYI